MTATWFASMTFPFSDALTHRLGGAECTLEVSPSIKGDHRRAGAGAGARSRAISRLRAGWSRATDGMPARDLAASLFISASLKRHPVAGSLR